MGAAYFSIKHKRYCLNIAAGLYFCQFVHRIDSKTIILSRGEKNENSCSESDTSRTSG
jgi:hypothetical protein